MSRGATRRAWLRTAAALVAAAVAYPATASAQFADHQAARAAVERFLQVLGNRQLDQLAALVAPRATRVVVRQRDGQWSHTAYAREGRGGLETRERLVHLEERRPAEVTRPDGGGIE